jgi:hypothetical protein
VAAGRPFLPSLKPSPRPSMPKKLSKLWFSIISTTMCSMPGSVSVPAGRSGTGTEPGRRSVVRPRARSACAYCAVAGVVAPGVVAAAALPPSTAGASAPTATAEADPPRKRRLLTVPSPFEADASGSWLFMPIPSHRKRHRKARIRRWFREQFVAGQ